jgi:hypothetical protein
VLSVGVIAFENLHGISISVNSMQPRNVELIRFTRSGTFETLVILEQLWNAPSISIFSPIP